MRLTNKGITAKQMVLDIIRYYLNLLYVIDIFHDIFC